MRNKGNNIFHTNILQNLKTKNALLTIPLLYASLSTKVLLQLKTEAWVPFLVLKSCIFSQDSFNEDTDPEVHDGTKAVKIAKMTQRRALGEIKIICVTDFSSGFMQYKHISKKKGLP